MKEPSVDALHLEDSLMGLEQGGEEWKVALKEQSENIQYRLFSIKFFKVILNFMWKDQRVENSKEQFWRTTEHYDFH